MVFDRHALALPSLLFQRTLGGETLSPTSRVEHRYNVFVQY